MGYWTRAWWLSNISTSDAGRPVLWAEARAAVDYTGYTLHVVDHWTPPPANMSHRHSSRALI